VGLFAKKKRNAVGRATGISVIFILTF
jgi:hypothetical protein